MDWQTSWVLWLQAARTPWLDPIMWVPHALGSAGFYTPLLPVLYLALGRRRGVPLIVVLALSFGLNEVLKDWFATQRPYLVLGFEPLYGTAPADRSTPAFPSGHAQGTAAFWWSMAVLAQRRWMYGLAVGLALFVGFSRVYAGVHWPVDVLGGWALGFGVTIPCWWLIQRMAVVAPSRGPLFWVGAGALLLAAMLPWSLRALPYVGLVLGLAGAHFATDAPPPARDRSFWWAQVMPTLALVGAALALAASLFPGSLLAKAVVYAGLGGWLTLAARPMAARLSAAASRDDAVG